LGHVLNAIYVWGVARALGGSVVLRLEDHDRGRCRPEYERAILEDLEWLGLESDVGPPKLSTGQSVFRQSDRNELYDAVLQRLRSVGRVYGCDCTRKGIAAGAAGDVPEKRYSGRCRARGLQLEQGLGVRLVVEEGGEGFTDLLLGPQSQQPARQCGDLLLRDRLDNWTYQFAVTVDDMDQGIDLVIRGEDLLPSTGRQLQLARILGRPKPPVFLHHPLIRRPDGTKLSKANLDSGIRQLRDAGMTPSAVLGLAAFRAGLVDGARELPAGELYLLFMPHKSHFSRRFAPEP
jgi:glutamyl-Q tRNA(Asp) synthetase